MKNLFTKFVTGGSRLVSKALLLLVVLVSAGSAYGQTPQFINTSATGGANVFPFSSANNKVQWLIAPGEFTGAYAGNITKFYPRFASSTTATLANFVIRMGQFSLGTCTSNLGTSIPWYSTGLQTVFSQTSYSITTTANGFFPITLQNPFYYNPAQYLLVSIEMTSTSGPSLNQYTPGCGLRRMWGPSTGANSIGSGGECICAGIDMASAANNDIGVAVIDSPTTFCSGSQRIVATVKNFGRNQVTSWNVNWSLNGTLQTPISSTLLLDTVGTTNNTRSVFLGNYTFPSSPATVIKAWTSMPNGVVDTVRMNDTATVSKAPAISGAFTIDPAGSGPTNFTTFAAAVSAMQVGGICGPVTFTVAPGTYNTRVVVPAIQGASATNTITFDGVDTSTRIITFAGTTTSGHGTFELSGADYVRIKNFRIRATGANYGIGVHLNGGADYNIVENCVIEISATTNTYAVGVGICGATFSTYGNNGNYNIIRNNRVTGGYCSVSITGTNTTTFSQGNQLLDNLLTGSYQYGIFSYYNNIINISGNRLYMLNAIQSNYGLYAYYNNNCTYDRNIIRAGYMGLYLYYCNYTNNPGSGTANNNIVFGQTYTSGTYPFYFLYSSNMQVYHNTIIQSNVSTSTAYLCYAGYGSNNHFRNNIFHNYNSISTNSWAMYAINSSVFATCNYNIYYSAHATNFVYFGGSSSNLAGLKALATTFNQNSLSLVSAFVNPTGANPDYHISPTVVSPTGDGTVGVAVDVDNEARCTFAPTIGADESKYPVPPPTANYLVPDTVYVNSPATFLNYYPATAPSAHQWYVDGVYQSPVTNLIYTFPATGTYAVKLVTFSCGGVDSVTKTVTVVNPTRVPQSDFISDVNTIDVYQTIKFTDLSQFGPTTWLWSVSPGTAGTDWNFTNGTTPGSQNPQISFSTPGNYTICMQASNGIGSGNNLCKTNYINVRSTNYMCIFPFNANSFTGVLFDDGGPNGNYSNNLSGANICNFLIEPCAASVTLTFSSFNMAANDFVRVFNGPTATSPPLHTGSGFTGTLSPFSVTSTGGKMLVQIVTDAGTNAPGFAATWTSGAATFPAPSGTIIGPDTAYTGGTLTTYSCSFVDNLATYTWDFENDGIDDVIATGAAGATAQYSFAFAGTTVNKLTISNCGGVFVTYDTIEVLDPSTPPTPDFTANLFVASSTDTIKLKDLSGIGPIAWNWTITGPSNAIYAVGNNQSQNPQVFLPIAGTYTVKLVVCNSYGCDSITKTNYITIIGYCTPVVGTLNPDLAISKVMFAGIDWQNITPTPGSVAYRDLTQVAQTAIVDQGGSYSITVERLTNYNNINRKVWIDYNKDGTFDPVTELVATQTQSSLQNWVGSISIPKTAALGLTRMRIGTAFSNYANSPCGPNTFGDFNDFRINVTADVTKPVITLTGADTVYVEIGRTYTDPGYTASDNVDGVITSTVVVSGFMSGTQITSMTPQYTYYDVTDVAGNDAVQKVRVIIPTADVTAPVITMVGGSPQRVEVKTSYTDSGATATDFYFGSLTSSIVTTNTVDINVVGTYTVTYNVSDAAGNPATPVIRTVIVEDTQKPVITLIGNDTININVYSVFVDPGVTVTDNYDVGLGYTVTGSVNTTLLGTYILQYSTTDAAGNVAVVKTRVVNVLDRTAPQITMVPPDTMVIEVNTLTAVPEPGYILRDNYYPVSSLIVAKQGTVNLNVLGTYTLQYLVYDPSGNVDSSAKRVYKVVDTTKPTIVLNGSGVIQWCRWKPFVDPGVTITDNYYTGLSPVIGGNLDVNAEGLYMVTYHVVDGSGNRSATVSRLVEVTTCANGLNENLLANAVSVYPNPSNGKFNLEFSLTSGTEVEVGVYSADGKLVYSSSKSVVMNDKLSVDLGNQAAGLYFVRITSANEVVNKLINISK